MKKDNVLLLAAGIAGAALGYFVGKKYGDSISEKVNDFSEDADKIKEEVNNITQNSAEIVSDLKTKAVDLISELEGKLNTVNEIIKKNEQ